MLDVLTAADVRRQDAGCEAMGIPIDSLMEAAGAAVARAARLAMGGTYGRRVVVVCGTGNNGGDGLVAARRLIAAGAHVTAILTRGDVAPAAARNLARFRAEGGQVAGIEGARRALGRADLAIDAVLGVGIGRAPDGATEHAIRAVDAASCPIASVDVPSGLDADTGIIRGAVVRADFTVTLGGLKPGLMFAGGRALAGRVLVADIGVPVELSGGVARALEWGDLAPARRGPAAHKRSSGVTLIVAGSRAMPGAAALVTGACVRAGSGLTVLAAPESVCAVATARTPEITTIPLPDNPEGILDEKSLELIRSRLGEFDALGIGPGLSTHPAALEAVRALVADAAMPAVCDADALTALAAAPEIVRARTAPTVLTPHGGEMARLTGRDAASLQADRLDSARRLAGDLGATVVFKGMGSVVAGPGGETYVNPTGGPALAQGGSGDVLTGMLASSVAQRAASGEPDPAGPRAVAETVWLHGAAGDLGARRAGSGAAVDAGSLPGLASRVRALLAREVSEVDAIAEGAGWPRRM